MSSSLLSYHCTARRRPSRLAKAWAIRKSNPAPPSPLRTEKGGRFSFRHTRSVSVVSSSARTAGAQWRRQPNAAKAADASAGNRKRSHSLASRQHISPNFVDLFAAQQVAPLRHAAVLALGHRVHEPRFVVMGKLPQVVCDTPGIHHVKSVTMRTVCERRAPCLWRPFGCIDLLGLAARDPARLPPRTRIAKSPSPRAARSR